MPHEQQPVPGQAPPYTKETAYGEGDRDATIYFHAFASDNGELPSGRLLAAVRQVAAQLGPHPDSYLMGYDAAMRRWHESPPNDIASRVMRFEAAVKMLDDYRAQMDEDSTAIKQTLVKSRKLLRDLENTLAEWQHVAQEATPDPEPEIMPDPDDAIRYQTGEHLDPEFEVRTEIAAPTGVNLDHVNDPEKGRFFADNFDEPDDSGPPSEGELAQGRAAVRAPIEMRDAEE